MSIQKPRPNLQDEEPVINSRVSELEDIWTSRLKATTQSFDSDDHLQQPINGVALYLGENDDRESSRKYQDLQLIVEKWTRLIILCNIAAPTAAIIVSWYVPLLNNKSSNLRYDITSWNLFYLCCALAWFNLLKTHRDLRSLLQELRTLSIIIAGLQCLSHILLSTFSIIICWVSAGDFQRPLFSYATFPFLQFSSTILLPVIQLLISLESIIQSGDYSPSSEIQLNDMPPHLEIASQEIHDVAHMVTSIIEQYAPTSIPTASQEYLSSCSIAMPIASTLAINTAMKEIIHISSCLQKPSSSLPPEKIQTSNFDLCELLQSVGDAMEGICASLDVAMVIYFTDSEWKSICIKSNPGFLRHGLIRVLTTLLNKATVGSTIEMTLNIRNLDSSSEDVKSQSGDDSGTLGIDIEIALIPCAESQAKVEEICKSDFLPNQIELLRGTVEVAGSAEEGRQAVEIFFEAPQRSEDNAYPVPTDLSNLDGDSEGYHALENFYELLKDMKIALYAMENSHFAKHLTNCLTNWSMNITHFSINELRQQLDSVGSDRTLKDAVSSPPTTSVSYPHQAPFPVSPGSPYTSPATTENERYDTTDAKFIIIDDDIPTLKRQIMNRQAAVASDASIRPRTSNRRTKGGFNGRLDIRYPEISPQSTIIFFTSLKNYKQVREIMMSNVNPWSKQSYALAHIVAVPKPACPRRILTALFTAWNKKSVDPQFTPIASLPTSPLTSNSSYSSQSNYQEHMSPPTPHGDGYIMVDSNGRKHERGIDSPLARDTETGHYFSPSYSTLHPSMGNSLKNHASPAGMVVDEGMLFVPGNRTPHSLPRTKNPTKKSQLSPKAQSPTKQDKFLEAPHPNETSADYNASGIPKTRTPYTNSNEFLNGGSPAHMAVGDDLSSKVSDTSTCKSGTSPITIVTDTTHSRNTTPDLDDKLGDAMPPVDGPLPTPHLTGDMQVDYQKQAPDQLQPPKLPDKATLRRASLKRKKKLSLNKSVSPSIQVLIVEDNIINQVILSKWMKNHGIKYEVASNGQEAFDKWSQGAFHLILMDIQLPVMDGITCTKKIRAVEKENKLQQMQQSLHREVPRSLSFDTLGSMEEKATEFRSPVIIVALTASSLDSDRQEALAAGCNDFLTKPVSMEWLDRKITEWGCMQALIDYEGWRQWREAKQSATSNQVVDDKQPDIISKPVQPERKASSSTNRSGVMMKGGSAIKPPSQRSATS